MPDPDAALLVQFRHFAQPNEAKSVAAGRLVCDDLEVVEIRAPGSKQTVGVHPANAVSHWVSDPFTGGQSQITYAERFARQYQQFKQQTIQTKSGTPLEQARFLTEARRAELRSLNIYTLEALASIDGQELKNIGPGGRELKNAAMHFIEEAKQNVPSLQMQAELDALRARNAVLEEDAEARRRDESAFDGMSLDQLRDYIEEQTGHAPVGSLTRKSLVRSAMACRPERSELR
jgi:hypothetical protein